MTADATPARTFEALDAILSEPVNDGFWETIRVDDAAAVLARLDDDGWAEIARALADPARDVDWKDKCRQVLSYGPIERAAPLAIAGLLSGDEAMITRCCDLLRDWRPELVPPIPPEAIAAARRVSQTTTSLSHRLGVDAFLTWAGAR